MGISLNNEHLLSPHFLQILVLRLILVMNKKLFCTAARFVCHQFKKSFLVMNWKAVQWEAAVHPKLTSRFTSHQNKWYKFYLHTDNNIT